MAHIVLLGDSIFDNKAYVGADPDVVSHLRAMMPADWQATLKAVDGHVVENVEGQLQSAPPDATHFVISAGGNNALMNADILGLKVNSAAAVFDALAGRTEVFRRHYRAMLEAVLGRRLPTAVCTVYEPNFSEPFMQRIASAALTAFNDVIVREAVSFGLPVLDLRLICSEKADYANEIEPSGRGGGKIAAAILKLVQTHDFAARRTQIFI